MTTYTFNFENRAYPLSEENCLGVIHDELKPLQAFDLDTLWIQLNQSQEPIFDVEYFESACESCRFGKAEKAKHFKFIEGHFYAFSKSNQYVMSSLSSDYEGKSFNELVKKGIVDGCYLVSIIVCHHCGDFSIEIEYGDF